MRAAGRITRAVAQEALAMLGIDENGLDEVDRNLMLALLDKFGGGPVGVGTLAAVLSEEEDAIEEMYEPYLMQIGMIDRTPRGRMATKCLRILRRRTPSPTAKIVLSLSVVSGFSFQWLRGEVC